MAAIGMLEFDGKRLDLKPYEKFLKPFKPLGRDKRILVEMLNYTPLQVPGQPGKKNNIKFGGRKNIMVVETVMLPIMGANNEVKEYQEGILQYFETKTPNQRMQGSYLYEPVRLPFESGRMLVPATNEALLFFIIVSGRNQANSRRLDGTREIGWANTPPQWRIAEPLAGAKKAAKSVNLKFEAMQRVKLAFKADMNLAKQLYLSLGHTDWDMYVNDKGEGEFSQIESILMVLCDTDPQKVIDKLSDGALDITAKIAQALAYDVIKQEGDIWMWGPKAGLKRGDVKGKYADLPVKDKTIFQIPKGKGATPELILAAFADYLKSDANVLGEIKREFNLTKDIVDRAQ